MGGTRKKSSRLNWSGHKDNYVMYLLIYTLAVKSKIKQDAVYRNSVVKYRVRDWLWERQTALVSGNGWTPEGKG